MGRWRLMERWRGRGIQQIGDEEKRRWKWRGWRTTHAYTTIK
jgi:hypothetical protein